MSGETCPHLVFEAHVIVDRLDEVGKFLANVNVRCRDCRTRFRWQGLQMGVDLQGTMVSVDGFELRGAIVPDGHLTSLMAGPVSGFPIPRGFVVKTEDGPVDPDKGIHGPQG